MSATRICRRVTVFCLIVLIGMISCRENRSKRIERDLDRVAELRATGEDDKALEILFDAQSRLDETVSPEVKVNLYTALLVPYYDSYSHRYGIAKEYAKKAVEVAREADSLEWLPGLLWNVVLNTNSNDTVISLLSECRDLSDLYGNKIMAMRSRIFLAKATYLRGDFKEAERIFDSISGMDGQLESYNRIELDMERAWMYRHEGDMERALSILSALNSDSLSLDGKTMRFEELYEINRNAGRFREALVYGDSLTLCRDSINKIISTEKLSQAENKFSAKLIREEEKQRRLWWVAGAGALILMIVIIFLAKSRAMKSRQVKLIKKISELNVRLAALENVQETQSDDKISPLIENLSPLIEKMRLTKEFYFTLRESSLVSQLNMVPNPDDIPKEKLKALTESVIGNFSEVSVLLRQAAPSLTQDDALFCLLSFIGLEKGALGAVMRSSDEALRKRKSRVKQKLPSELFDVIFSKSM